MYAFNGCTQSISFVAFKGAEIIGEVAMVVAERRPSSCSSDVTCSPQLTQCGVTHLVVEEQL